MRGKPTKLVTMLTLETPEKRVRPDHPLRRVKAMADAAVSPTFDAMYREGGRQLG
jgi:hypothetical protein